MAWRAPNIKIKVQGPYNPQQATKTFLNVFQSSVRIEAANLMRSLAAKIKEEVRTAIDWQLYRWKPLSPPYLAWKEAEGYDPRTLIKSRFYWEHIDWWMDSNGVHVGVKNVVHPDTKKLVKVFGKKVPFVRKGGIRLPVLARMHEFGTDTIPPRPHWRPAFAKVLGEFPKLRRNYYARVRKATKEATRRAR